MRRIAVAGKNSIAVKVIDFLLDELNWPIDKLVGLCNRNDDGIPSWQPSFKNHLKLRGVEELTLKDVYAWDDLLFLSLEFDRIIRPHKFATPDLFNIHFSLLPAYKGVYTSAWPILNGETESGVTLHRIDPGIDTGEIIEQQRFPIDPDDTALDLYLKFLDHSFELFKTNIEDLIKGSFYSRPQAAERSSYYALGSIDYSNLQINLNQTAWQIKNQIRAFSFRYYQLPNIHGFEVMSSSPTSNRSTEKPGTLLRQDDFSMLVSTVDYDLEIKKDQQARLLAAAEENDLETIQSIIDSGYPINQKDKRGWNAMVLATYNGNKEAFELLLKHGGDPHTQNFKGTDLYMYAFNPFIEKSEDYFLKRLHDLGVSPFREDYHGKNAVVWAGERCPEAVSIINPSK